MVSAKFNKIAANSKENETLAATRDLLLPKLMSGEICLKNAEKAAEAVL
jgi:type I restriction enzyme, S subunit